MDVNNCVFVVACDYDVVREGVRALMKIDDKDKVDAFFHKIFQVPFHMPIGAYSIDSMFERYVVDKMLVSNGFSPANDKKVKDFLRKVLVTASTPIAGSSNSLRWLRLRWAQTPVVLSGFSTSWI